MGRLLGGAGLLLLALFMFVGFLGSDSDAAAGARFGAFVIAVLLPGAAGAALLRSYLREKRGVGQRKAELRDKTLEAELLRLASKHAGKLTIVEAVAELAISPEEAKTGLDALARRGLADFEVTDSGVVVYAFHDLQRLSEKPHSRGILE